MSMLANEWIGNEPPLMTAKANDLFITHSIYIYAMTYIYPKNNDLFRQPTELVQHLQRGVHISAARHITDTVWLYRLPIPVGTGGGTFYLLK
jgi:hypothetical protein